MIYFKHSVYIVYFQNCMTSLIRNDNKDNIGDIVNVKTGPSSYSILSISLQAATCPAP